MGGGVGSTEFEGSRGEDSLADSSSSSSSSRREEVGDSRDGNMDG